MRMTNMLWILPVALIGAGCREDSAPASQDNALDTGSGGTMADDPANAAAGSGGAPAVGSYDCDLPTDAVVCGGMDCGESSEDQALICVAHCCTEDDACGLQVRIEGQKTTPCNAELDAVPDPRCPDDDFVDGSTGTGCCDDSGQCGLIDPVFGLGCVERSMVYGVELQSMDCDGEA